MGRSGYRNHTYFLFGLKVSLQQPKWEKEKKEGYSLWTLNCWFAWGEVSQFEKPAKTLLL
jgi:hypothetical protein